MERFKKFNEAVDKSAISAALSKAAEKENMKSKRDVERFFDYSGGDIIFRMVKDEEEANQVIGHFKSQYKQKFKEETNEGLDDISVGAKKKLPAGVKADPTVKGYAYNEKDFKPHMMYDPKTGKAHKAEKPEDHERMSKLGYTHEKPEVKEASDMSLDDIKKKYAKEIIRFQDGDGDLSGGAKMAMMGYVGSDGIKTDDPDEFDNFVMGLKMGKYKKTNEQQSMDTLLDMLDETNLDEALSPKEKEKRLQMIKKAVEKLNRANIEKVKKMAMRDMKASGMFDDAMDENSAIGGYRDPSKDGQQGPEDQKKKRERDAARAKRDSSEGQIEMYKKRIEDLERSQREIERKAYQASEAGDDERAENLEDRSDQIQKKINGFRDSLADLRKGK